MAESWEINTEKEVDENVQALKKVVSRFTLADAVMVAFPLVVMAAVFVLPAGVRQAMVLNYSEPSLLTFYSSIFVHSSIIHLLSNVALYLVAISFLYTLGSWGEFNSRLRLFLGFCFAALPLVLGFLDSRILAGIFETGMGFSGINSALIGFTPLVIAAFMRQKTDGVVNLTHSIPVFYLSLIVSLVFISLYRSSALLGALVVVVLMAAYFGYLYHQSESGHALMVLYNSFNRISSVELAVLYISLVLYITAPVGFLQMSIQSGQAANVFAHYNGFATGFLLPYFVAALYRVTGFDFL